MGETGDIYKSDSLKTYCLLCSTKLLVKKTKNL
jgi:hypothetical protein